MGREGRKAKVLLIIEREGKDACKNGAINLPLESNETNSQNRK